MAESETASGSTAPTPPAPRPHLPLDPTCPSTCPLTPPAPLRWGAPLDGDGSQNAAS